MKSFKEYVAESHMSEVHMTVSGHLDKHIKKYKNKTMDADTLGGHCIKCAKSVAKEHGIELKHAHKLVNDYVDGELG